MKPFKIRDKTNDKAAVVVDFNGKTSKFKVVYMDGATKWLDGITLLTYTRFVNWSSKIPKQVNQPRTVGQSLKQMYAEASDARQQPSALLDDIPPGAGNVL